MKSKCFTLGIDTASTSITVCLLDSEGKSSLAGRQFALGKPGFTELIHAMAGKGAGSGNTRVLIEATGRHHLPWVAALEQEGFQTVVLNPALSGHAKPLKQFIRGNKSDPIDAEGLAQLARYRWEELQACSNRIDPSRQALKFHCSARSHLRKTLTNTMKAAQDMLHALWPEARELKLAFGSCRHGLPSLFIRIRSRAELCRLQAATLKQHSILRAQELRDAARNSFVSEELFDAGLPALQHLCRTLIDVRAHLEDLEKEIVHRVRNVEADENYRIASTIPSFGDRTIPVLLAYLPAQWRQWGSKRAIANKLQAYWGMDPKMRQSGKWKGQVKMSKRGCEPPRTALMNIARISLMKDCEMKKYYERKKAEGKAHTLALTDIMRRQLRRFVAVIFDQKPFVQTPKLALDQ